MSTSIVVPELGESVHEARVARWLKQQGEPVEVGEAIVELETEKTDLEVGAAASGVLAEVRHGEGDDVKIGEVLGIIEAKEERADMERAGRERSERPERAAKDERAREHRPTPKEERPARGEHEPERPSTHSASSGSTVSSVEPSTSSGRAEPFDSGHPEPFDSVRPEPVEGTNGARDRLGRRMTFAQDRPVEARTEPVEAHKPPPKEPARRPEAPPSPETSAAQTKPASEVGQRAQARREAPGAEAKERESEPEREPEAEPEPERERAPEAARAARAGVTVPVPAEPHARPEEPVRLSKRRLTIARRLVEAQRTAAMLTTFNDVDMSAVMDLRRRIGPDFEKRHGVRLGIVSFFVKAAVLALREFPWFNAELEGEEVLLKYYYDIGVAIGAAEGLVVPVLREADRMSFGQIERAIKEFVRKAEQHELSLEDLRGGTFTITNGGVFGSLLSTPILNPPQVGILGLHRIEERAQPLDGQIAVRQMMYLALTYDHRIVDGRDAVQFLGRIKGLVEEPGALLVEG